MHELCLFVDTTEFGGAENHTLNLINYLINNDIYVNLIECRSNVYDNLVPFHPSLKLIKCELSTRCNDSDYKLWMDFLSDLPGDVGVFVKGYFLLGDLAFLKAMRSKFKRLVFIEHFCPSPMPQKTSKKYLGGIIKGLSLWWYKELLLRKKRFSYPDKVIAVSKAVSDSLIYNKYCDANKISVVSNGVDIDKFYPDQITRNSMREMFNLTEDQLVFGMATRLVNVKNIDAAINAIKSVSAKVDSYLIIVGAGPLEDQLRNLVVHNQLIDRVKIIGFKNEMMPYYNLFDFIVMPSEAEGLPLSLLEGMACGCIPIVSNAGGMPEVAKDVGIVIDKKKDILVAELINSMMTMSLMNKNQIYDMKKLCRQKVARLYADNRCYCDCYSLMTVSWPE